MNCSIEGCGEPARTRGWCRKHYTRWQRHGDPLIAMQIQGDNEARFLAKTRRLPNGCLEWTGYVNPYGYGKFGSGGRYGPIHLAHRWAYNHWVGPIPPNGTVDHLCHNAATECKGGVTCPHRRCVEPSHLDATKTLAENVARSMNAPINRSHCPKGHPYDDDNTGYSRGCRYCKMCHRQSEARRRIHQQKTKTHCKHGHAYEPNNFIIGSDGRKICKICASSKH